MDYASRAQKKEAEREEATMETLASTELGEEIQRVFKIFDEIGNNCVDPERVPLIVRGLGCVPSETELQEIMAAVWGTSTETGGTGLKLVSFNKFLPPVFKMICEERMKPATSDELLEAFRKLDSNGVGTLRREWFAEVMMKEGECLSSEEADQMLRLCVDPDSGRVDYDYYVNQLTGITRDVYAMKPTLAELGEAVEDILPRESTLSIIKRSMEVARASRLQSQQATEDL